jgi:hypothetical protein
LVAPDEDEKRLPLLILILSHEGARGKSSPFRKGGKGEFDFYCSVIARNKVTWQSLPPHMSF